MNTIKLYAACTNLFKFKVKGVSQNVVSKMYLAKLLKVVVAHVLSIPTLFLHSSADPLKDNVIWFKRAFQLKHTHNVYAMFLCFLQKEKIKFNTIL